MKRVALERVQARLGEYVESSVKQPVLILRNGEPVAMLVGLHRNRKRTPTKLRDVLKRAWKDYQQHGAVPHDEFWSDLANETRKKRRRAVQ